EKKGNNLVLTVGYSHQVTYPEPKGITLSTTSPTTVVIEGIDKQQVGQVAAEIRAVRPPEPYKGKGIRYTGEQVRRKAGKTGAEWPRGGALALTTKSMDRAALRLTRHLRVRRGLEGTPARARLVVLRSIKDMQG